MSLFRAKYVPLAEASFLKANPPCITDFPTAQAEEAEVLEPTLYE